MNREYLRLMTLGEEGPVPFLDEVHPIDILTFKYTAQRMGTSEIECTLMHWKCLDDYWTGREYVEFRGARYFLTHVPSSGKDTTDERYSHQLRFRCERDMILASTYFYDGIQPDEDPTTAERYHSNNTKFSFYGTLDEFCGRLKAVLSYRGLTQFDVRVDDSVARQTEAKLAEFSDKKIFEVLSYAYELWEVPFWFDGYTICFGVPEDEVIDEVFEYGPTEELTSIKKQNEETLAITSISGHGGSKNVPYYYPNKTPKGDIDVTYNGGVVHSLAQMTDPILFAERFPADEIVTYYDNPLTDMRMSAETPTGEPYSGGNSISFWTGTMTNGDRIPVRIRVRTRVNGNPIAVNVSYDDIAGEYVPANKTRYISTLSLVVTSTVCDERVLTTDSFEEEAGGTVTIQNKVFTLKRLKTLTIHPAEDMIPGREYEFVLTGYVYQQAPVEKLSAGIGGEALPQAHYSCLISIFAEDGKHSGWYWKDGSRLLDPTKFGFEIKNDRPEDGDEIGQALVGEYIQPSEWLLPPLFRENPNLAPFYHALNHTYLTEDGSRHYEFQHEWNPLYPKEYIQDFEDIYPTIVGMTYGGNRIDQLADVYLEPGYNVVDVDADGNRVYGYFYMKLRPLGFNLFAQASEKEAATIEMTSGQCGACKFRIIVNDRNQNTVQVTDAGSLYVDENTGKVIEGTPQDGQNDTTSHSVWLKVQIDDSTFGGGDHGTMPSWNSAAGRGQKPSSGDTFVLTGINMPEAYILAAEERLKHALLQFMEDNNIDKYTFPIVFSRVDLAQRPALRDQISERSALKIRYNGVMLPSPLYVSTYTYRADENEVLPEITVELKDSLGVAQNVLDEKIKAAFEGYTRGIGGSGGMKREDADIRYLRKDIDDKAAGLLTLLKGAQFGNFRSGIGGTGAAVSIDEYGYSRMELDFLNVRKLAQFTELEIDKLTSVGGRILVSLANMTCTEVVPVDAYEVDGVAKKAYICRFSNGGEEGALVQNSFAVGDLAICQSFNLGSPQYYWRLVIATGDDYIVLSDHEYEGGVGPDGFRDFEEGSTVPQAGDVIVQLGNRNNIERQAAQIISCYGENAPSLTMYAGINDFTLVDRDMFGVMVEKTTEQATDEDGNLIFNEDGSPVMVTRYSPKLYNYGDMYMGERKDENGRASSYIEWDAERKTLVIRGAVDQAPDGSVTDKMRGNWTAGRLYFEGDIVSYDGKLYRCRKDYPREGFEDITPLNTEYWELYVEGGGSGDGKDGKSMHVYNAEASLVSGEYRGRLSGVSPSPVNIGDLITDSTGEVFEVTRLGTTYWYGNKTGINLKGGKGEDAHSPKIVNGEWWVWDDTRKEYVNTGVKAEGQTGPAAVTKFKSTVFKRSVIAPSRPSGGSYDRPLPNPLNGWSDGVPKADGTPLWMSTNVFKSDDTDEGWTDPQLATDTNDLDVEYNNQSVGVPAAPAKAKPSDKSTDGWYDESDGDASQAVWMAVRKVQNGEYVGNWVLTRIKGEQGEPGGRGMQGFPGCIYRLTVWESGKLYRNDEDLDPSNPVDRAKMDPSGLRYVDVVTDREMAIINSGAYYAYLCKVTHTSGSDKPLPSGTGSNTWWMNMQAAQPMVTPLLIAKQIGAELINVESLAANEAFINSLDVKSIVTDLIQFGGIGGKYLQITGSGINVLDSSLNPVMVFSGQKRYAHVNAFADSVNSSSASVSSYRASESPDAPANDSGWVNVSFSPKEFGNNINVQNPCRASVSGTISVSVSKNYSGADILDTGYVTAALYLKDTTTELLYPLAYRTVGGTQSNNNQMIPAGTYKLAVSVIGGSKVRYSSDSDFKVTVSVSVPSCTLSFAGVDEHTEIFANGMGYKKDANNYMAVVGGDNNFEWEAKATNGTIVYGLKVDKTGIKGNYKGAGYENLMCVLLAGTYTYTITDKTKSVTVHYSALGIKECTGEWNSSIRAVELSWVHLGGFGTNYAAIVTPHTNSSSYANRIPSIISKTPTGMNVRILDENKNGNTTSFDFVIIGYKN